MLEDREKAAFLDKESRRLADALNAASTAGDQKQVMQIEQQFNALLNVNPRHPLVTFMLGTIYSMTGRSGSAIAMLEKAIEYGALGPGPWINLGNTWKQEHDDEQAKTCFEMGLKQPKEVTVNGQRIATWLAGDEASLLQGLASLYINAGEPDECIKWAERALEAEPGSRFALWNRGLAYLEKGNWRDGFYWYDKAGFMTGGGKPAERKLKTYGGLPMWQGQPDQRVICYGEQGVGDEVMFASIIPDLIAMSREVIIDGDKRLEGLFKRSFPGCKVFTTSGLDDESPWRKDVEADCVVSMGSLGRYFRKKDADFPKTPYLIPSPERTAYWQARLARISDRPKVGISWVGGTKKTRVDYRSIRPEVLYPLLDLDCEFISLQYHDWAADECVRMGNDVGKTIWHWGPTAKGVDYDDTAGLLAALDLVITVNTSVLHLAGAVGAPTLCLTPHAPAWRYGVSGPNPWYGSVKTLRQKRGETWEPVVEKACEIVRKRLLGEKREAA